MANGPVSALPSKVKIAPTATAIAVANTWTASDDLLIGRSWNDDSAVGQGFLRQYSA